MAPGTHERAGLRNRRGLPELTARCKNALLATGGGCESSSWGANTSWASSAQLRGPWRGWGGGGWCTLEGCRLWGHILPEHRVLLTANNGWESGTGGTQQHRCRAGGLRAPWRASQPRVQQAAQCTQPAHKEGVREPTTPITPTCTPKSRAPLRPHHAFDRRSLWLSCSD